MKKTIKIINPESLIKGMQQMDSGERVFFAIERKDFEVPFSEVKPTDGYEPTVNKDTNEVYPNCCAPHKLLLKRATGWFEKFPDCCEPHRRLLNEKWFDKNNYVDAPMKIMLQLSYTINHIGKHANNSDWYEDITDYIEYNVSGFGQLPEGYGNPVGLHVYEQFLGNWISDTKNELPNEKREKLIEYLTRNEQSTEANTDMNILYLTYQKWLKTFPFGISYFSELKEYFSKHLPFISGPTRLNKYTGMRGGKMITQAALVEALTERTRALLNKIDSVELVEKKLITDTDKHSLEIISASHRIKQNSLLNEFSKGEIKYVTILKKWLANERVYFKRIAPLIKSLAIDAKGSTTSSFDYSNLKLYFFDDKIEGFKQIENEMMQREFFQNGEWHYKKPKKLLVAFIHILQKLSYLRPRLPNKSERAILLAYGRFFENRYKTKISKQNQPTVFKADKLKRYKADYFFIPGIENI